jgi:dephospho-CoA kinase
MVIVGLTGSIGMGKTTAARMLRRMGVPVHDADAQVHRLYGRDREAIAAIAAAFPGSVRDGRVDRAALGAQVIGRPEALRRLEGIVHPRLAAARRRFLAEAARRRVPLVVLDVPLLFETGGERRVDATLVVSAPAAVQRARVLSRPGMTAEKLDGILARQMPDREKRRRADVVVPTGLGRAVTLRRLRAAVRDLRTARGRHWPPRAMLPRA